MGVTVVAMLMLVRAGALAPNRVDSFSLSHKTNTHNAKQRCLIPSLKFKIQPKSSCKYHVQTINHLFIYQPWQTQRIPRTNNQPPFPSPKPEPVITVSIVHQIVVKHPQPTLVPIKKVFVKIRLLEKLDKHFEHIIIFSGYGFEVVSQHGGVIVENVDDFRA